MPRELQWLLMLGDSFRSGTASLFPRGVPSFENACFSRGSRNPYAAEVTCSVQWETIQMPGTQFGSSVRWCFRRVHVSQEQDVLPQVSHASFKAV